MKNLLLTLFTVLIASASFSQVVNDVEIRLLNPLPGANQGGTDIVADYTIKNNGPAILMAGDTMFGAFIIPQAQQGDILVDDFSFILSANMNVGDSLLMNINEAPPIISPTSAVTVNVCGFVYAQRSSYIDTGANLANNQSCYLWDVSIVGVDEISINDQVNAFVSYGALNLTSTTNDNYSYSIYSMSGQVISQGNFSNNKNVDMNGVAKGIYAVVISNGTEKITKKVAIQ